MSVGHSPLPSAGNLAQHHYPPLLWAWQEKVDLDGYYHSHKNISEFVLLSLFILSPPSMLYQHINIFFSLFLSFGVLELFMGNSSCLWGLELGDL